MRARAAVLALLLAACTAPGDGARSFRDQGTIIAATTRYDAARFNGDWQVRAAFPGDDQLVAVAVIPDLAEKGRVFELVRETCESNGDCEQVGEWWGAKELGQGRYVLDDPHGLVDRQVWVLWVDEGFRTAAVGSPDGRWGWILDRGGSGGADRIKAAREVLDFNGYDTSKLVVRQ